MDRRQLIDDENDLERGYMLAWGDVRGFERFSEGKANRRLRHWRDWTRRDDPLPAGARMG